MGKKYELGLEKAAHEAYKEQEQLEAQSLESIAAWCKDQSVQLEYCRLDEDNWMKKDDHPCFDLEGYYYRIAKPKKFYRVGLVETDRVIMVDSTLEEKLWQEERRFVRWLDERKYYD